MLVQRRLETREYQGWKKGGTAASMRRNIIGFEAVTAEIQPKTIPMGKSRL
jgi:hypothetical protein